MGRWAWGGAALAWRGSAKTRCGEEGGGKAGPGRGLWLERGEEAPSEPGPGVPDSPLSVWRSEASSWGGSPGPPAQRSLCCWPWEAALCRVGLLVPPGIPWKQSSLCSFDLLARSQANSLRISSAESPPGLPPRPLPDLLRSREGEAVCSRRYPIPLLHTSPVLWPTPKWRPIPGCWVREAGERRPGWGRPGGRPALLSGGLQEGAGRCKVRPAAGP